MKRIKHILCKVLVIIISMCIILASNITSLADDYESINSKNEGESEVYTTNEVGNDVNNINEALPTCLQNGGFEEPDISTITTRPNCQVDKKLVPYWDTTAFGNKIEMFKENNGIYTPGVLLKPREGKQAAELNADEISTLYQNIETDAGKTYEWGLSHRGRLGKDTMALIIGPRQGVAPASQSKGDKDQFMKMADWLKVQVDVDIGLNIPAREIGCSKKIILYSRPFEGVGTFVGGDVDAFSWERNDEHSEQWNIWLITSDKTGWNDYGTASEEAPDYDFTYEVPEGCPQSIFAFAAIQTANGKDTVGNLIDNITFKEYYDVEAYSTPGGRGTYVYDGYYDFDYYNNYTGNVVKDEGFGIMAHELTGDAYRKFIGANINGEFIDVSAFTSDGRGNYGYWVDKINKHYKVRLIFSGGFITYDINVGNQHVLYDDYHYDGTDNTNYEVPINSITLPSYTSHATRKYNADGTVNDDWRFIGWKYSNAANDLIFDGVHTVDYIKGADESLDTLKISGNVVGGGTGEISNISALNGAAMVAQWKYRQGFITKLWDNASKTYKDNAECGTISVRNIPEEAYGEAGKKCFGDTNEYITVDALASDGYEFRGWHDEAGNLVAPGLSYGYTIGDRQITTSYAYFTRVHDLTVIDEVCGNCGNKDKYFTTFIYLSNMEKNKTCTCSYSNNGNQNNPTSFTTDANGNVTIKCNLKHNGQINLTGLIEGSTYRVTENSYSNDGYTTTGAVTRATSLLTDASVTLINTKNVEIPLGVHNDAGPYLWMALVSIASLILIIIFYIKRKHKKSQE